MGFILAFSLVVLVSPFHQGHLPRQDQAYPAGPLPQIDCPTPAPDRASMCARTRGSVRRRWKRKPKEGNSLTHPRHRHQSTNRLNWGQNTRDGVLAPEDALGHIRGTQAQTRDKQRASQGCQVVAETETSGASRSRKSIFHARMLTMTAWRGTSVQSKYFPEAYDLPILLDISLQGDGLCPTKLGNSTGLTNTRMFKGNAKRKQNRRAGRLFLLLRHRGVAALHKIGESRHG